MIGQCAASGCSDSDGLASKIKAKQRNVTSDYLVEIVAMLMQTDIIDDNNDDRLEIGESRCLNTMLFKCAFASVFVSGGHFQAGFKCILKRC